MTNIRTETNNAPQVTTDCKGVKTARVVPVIAYATLKDGTRAAARDGVYMRSVVRVGSPGESTNVRANRWTRYLEEGAYTRMTGRGVANDAPTQVVHSAQAESTPRPTPAAPGPGRYSIIEARFAKRWPAAAEYLKEIGKQ